MSIKTGHKPFCFSHLTNLEGLKLILSLTKHLKSLYKIKFNQIRAAENLFTAEYFRDLACKTWLDVDVATNFKIWQANKWRLIAN